MNKSMVEYVNAMSGGDLETFENIIKHHFKKFTRFYKLVSSFSNELDDIEYSFSSKEELEVTLIFNKKSDVNKFKKKVEDKIIEKGYDGEVSKSGTTLNLKLILDEDSK